VLQTQICVTRPQCVNMVSTHITNTRSYRNSQQDATVYQNLLFHVYMKLNMFRATRRPSSRAQNCTSSLWFCVCERLWTLRLLDADSIQQPQCERLWTLRLLDADSVQQPQRPQPFTYAKPETASTVLSS